MADALKNAMQLMRSGRTAEAIKACRHLLVITRDNPDALHLLAVLLLQRGEKREALEYATRAQSLDAESAAIRSTRAVILAGLGKNEEALSEFQRIAEEQPSSPVALFNVANALRECGKLNAAGDYYLRTLSVDPSRLDAKLNLGIVLLEQKQIDSALATFRAIIAAQPQWAEAYVSLAMALRASGDLKASLQAAQEATRLNPRIASGWQQLGRAFFDAGDPDSAIDCFSKTLALLPDSPALVAELGKLLGGRGRLSEEINLYSRWLANYPANPELLNNYGLALMRLDRHPAAVAQFRQAIELKPDFPSAYSNLGVSLIALERDDEAVQAYLRAIELQPDCLDALNNLGNLQMRIGLYARAIESYRAAVRGPQGFADAHANLILAMHYSPDVSATDILHECQQFAGRYVPPPMRTSYDIEVNAAKKLRVGFLSADLRNHVGGWNLLPLLKHLDRSTMELVAYSNTSKLDNFTDTLREQFTQWRNVLSLSDDVAASQVRGDAIDILIDLTAHSAGQRLAVFGRQPAPVQITYLAYCSTTGVPGMNYRISDPYFDPPAALAPVEKVYSEETLLLPKTYWAYGRGGPLGNVGPSPFQKNGYITFGCLNTYAKISRPALLAWKNILTLLPKSRIIIYAANGPQERRVRENLSDPAIDAKRIECVGHQPWSKYISTYQRIDIALDPFPWTGGITSCDALISGVPLVTLAGQTAVGRGGASVLNNVGLPQFIARSVDRYVEIAINLASDPESLKSLRQTLRQQVTESPLMDPVAFARDFEALLRSAWQRWCARQTR